MVDCVEYHELTSYLLMRRMVCIDYVNQIQICIIKAISTHNIKNSFIINLVFGREAENFSRFMCRAINIFYYNTCFVSLSM